MGLECGGGELEVYELLGMDMSVPTSIPSSFKGTYRAWPVPYPRAAQAPPIDIKLRRNEREGCSFYRFYASLTRCSERETERVIHQSERETDLSLGINPSFFRKCLSGR